MSETWSWIRLCRLSSAKPEAQADGDQQGDGRDHDFDPRIGRPIVRLVGTFRRCAHRGRRWISRPAAIFDDRIERIGALEVQPVGQVDRFRIVVPVERDELLAIVLDPPDRDLRAFSLL